MIDANQFMNAVFTEANATRRSPVPPGEYKGVVEDVSLETIQGRKDPSKQYLRCNITWALDDSSLRSLYGRDRVTIVDSFLIDLTETGSLDFGENRNITLGQRREALDMNKKGQPWSFQDFKGRAARVRVDHEMYNGEPRARVAAVAKL